MPRLEEVSGVFPGHGTIDLHPKTLKYILDTANRVIYHPEWYDTKVDFFGTPMYAKFIYQQGSDLKYTKSAVIKEEDPEERRILKEKYNKKSELQKILAHFIFISLK